MERLRRYRVHSNGVLTREKIIKPETTVNGSNLKHQKDGFNNLRIMQSEYVSMHYQNAMKRHRFDRHAEQQEHQKDAERIFPAEREMRDRFVLDRGRFLQFTEAGNIDEMQKILWAHSEFAHPYRVCAACPYDVDPVFLAPNQETLVFLFMHGFDVNEHDSEGFTLLHRACMASDLDRVLFLLDYGASVLRPNSKTLETASHYTSSALIHDALTR